MHGDDARSTVETLLYEQTAVAQKLQAAPNTAARGDAKFKSLFYGKLTAPQQRTLFLDYVANQAHWPRVRSLFGAPPYCFLQHSDCHMLRAGGFAFRRVNMAKPSMAGTAAQFGATSMTDEQSRRFKHIGTGGAVDSLDTSAVSGNHDCLLHLAVLMPKRKRGELPVGLPRPGEMLRLTERKAEGTHTQHLLRVVRARSRSAGTICRTGLVTVKILA